MKCDGDVEDDDDDDNNHNDSVSNGVHRRRETEQKMTKMKHGFNFKMTANYF